MNNNRKPPVWADRLLEFYCRSELLEDLQGDLHEYYHRRLEDRGKRTADIVYWIDVFKFIRPYSIKKPHWFTNFQFNTMIFRNYLKTSFRNLTNSAIFSLVNILGLAVSMSIGLLIITLITELNTYDSFHEHGDRIYRVNNTFTDLKNDRGTEKFASTSVKAFTLIREEVPGIENAVLLRRPQGQDFQTGEKVIPVDVMYVSREFFNVFTFPMTSGNPATALSKLNSLVLTESAARKFFKEENPVGRTLSRDSVEYLVTGVVKDPPLHSHLQFEALGSWSTLERTMSDNNYFMNWDNMWMYHIYLKLAPSTSLSGIQAALDQIAVRENKALEHELVTITMGLQALSSILPGPDLYNTPGKSMDSTIIWALVILAAIILLSACFNYTNLSIARSLKRTREVGVRKVIGATSGQVFTQFVFESVVMALIGLVMAFGLFQLIVPHFLEIDGMVRELVTMETGWVTIGYFILFAIAVGILAGILPGWFFSRMNPEQVFKPLRNISSFKGLTINRILILIQFAFSLIFVIAATLAYNQYRFSVNFDLGYDTDNILNIELQGNDPEVLRNELIRLPEVEDISASSLVTSVGSYYGAYVKYQHADDSIHVWYNSVDSRYLSLHNHNIVLGETFRDYGEDPKYVPVIVNDLLIDAAGLPSDDEILGQRLVFESDTAEVVGVIGDFHYGTTGSRMQPFLFVYQQGTPYFLNLKIQSADMLSTLDRIEAVWRKLDDVHPFTAEFYEDEIEEAYSEYSVMIKIVGFIAFTAILIAFMGLLGMVVFTTESRIKEISVRKVMGASIHHILIVIGKSYFILLLLAAIVAVPATYYLFNLLILDGVAYKADITIVELGSGVMAIMLIAFFTIGFQVYKAARTNPARTLRNE